MTVERVQYGYWPYLIKLTDGWLVTYNGAFDNLWLMRFSEAGNFVSDNETFMAPYMCGGYGNGVYARLIEYGYDYWGENIRHWLVAHDVNSANVCVRSDTLFAETISYLSYVQNPVVDVADGTLMAAVPTALTDGDTTRLQIRILRYESNVVSVGEPWPVSGVDDLFDGFYFGVNMGCAPWGGALCASFVEDNNNLCTESIHAFGSDGQQPNGVLLEAWNDTDVTGYPYADVLTAYETVYTCNVRTLPDDPEATGVYVEAFPLSDILEVEDDFAPQPSSFSLSVYPNPFNARTILSFSLPRAGAMSVKLYDVTGRAVRTLLDERQTAGTHAIRFDAADLPSGVYLCRLNAGDYHATQKLILLR